MSLLKIEMMIHGKCCYSGHWFCIHGMLGWHTTWPIVLYRILLRKRVCIILLELLSQEIKFCALIQLILLRAMKKIVTLLLLPIFGGLSNCNLNISQSSLVFLRPIPGSKKKNSRGWKNSVFGQKEDDEAGNKYCTFNLLHSRF